MSTFTPAVRRLRSNAPTRLERILLRLSYRVESAVVARIERRAVLRNPITERARAEADERRRTAQALGSLGILPR